MAIYDVSTDNINQRADVFLQSQMPQLSRSFIKKMADGNYLLFNQQTIKAGYKFKKIGQLELTYDFNAPVDFDSPALSIVFEDDSLLVVNKPINLLTHAKNSNWHEPSIALSLRQYCHWSPLTYPVSIADLRYGIVHRLDKGTSGLLICGKSQASVDLLQTQFKTRTVEKTYLAIVSRNDDLPASGIIDKPISRHLRDGKKFNTNPSGRPSQTFFEVKKATERHYLLEVKPQTGRTHQIRVHLSSMRCPVVGDKLYKGESSSRMMLHSYKISFNHPITKQRLHFKTAYPSDFKQFLIKNA